MDLLELPEIVLRKIFFFLPIQSLGRLKCTCTKLRDMDFEDYWRVHFFRHSKIPHSVDRAPPAQSWRAECERSYDQTPIKLCQELPGHTVPDERAYEVHHVCFSHNGRLFATCSTSGEVKVWSTDHPCELFFGRNMNEEFRTTCPLFAHFNATDTKLFVAAKFMNENTIDIYCFDFDNTGKREPYKVETTLSDLGRLCFDSNDTQLVIIKSDQSPEIFLNDDVVFPFRANIVEIQLSPENRYLFVKYILNLMTKVDVSIQIFETTSLKTLETLVGPLSTLLSQDEGQSLHASISQLYVASVSKDNHGHLRDRQYSVPLHQFPHDDVIRCIAINPVDQEMLVTVGDNVIKVWRSRRKIRQLHADR